MSALLFAVARQIDGRRNAAQVADAVSSELGRRLSADDLEFLLETKLRPIGIVAGEESAPAAPRSDPLLGLRFRMAVVPAAWVRRIAWLAAPLFAPPAVLGVLLATALLDAWLIFVHGIAQAVRQVVLVPELGLLVLALVVVSTAMHEIGHAGAARYGGARPGPIGVGLYLAWPVFYSDVTDSYRLGRGGRLRTDLGGVYFNLVFALLVAAAYAASHFEPLLVVFALVQVEVLHQFFPFVRLDGYYVASDLIGVPDLFMRIRPTLASLWPGRPLHPQVATLKPWARFAVAAWVLLTLVTICVLYLLLIFGLPRLIGTAVESFALHAARVTAAAGQGDWPVAAGAALEELLLLLPLAALTLTFARVVRYLAVAGWRLGDRRPEARFALAVTAALVIGFAGGAMWPSDRYSPLRPSEHGTLRSAPVISEVVPAVSTPALFGGAQPAQHRPAPALSSAPAVGAPSGGSSTGGGSATPVPTPVPTAVSPTSAPSTPNPAPTPVPTATATPSAVPTTSPSP